MAASFHLIQIEQVIGGVNGDTSAQAIQLRLRFPGENLLEFARLVAWDNEGLNPITIVDFTQSVPGAALGARVLVASPAFLALANPVITADFVIPMKTLIPPSYLAAGRVTYEGDTGAIYWSLSYGGSAYTGETIATAVNDADGDFGPPAEHSIPWQGVRALVFQGSPSGASLTNLDDYALTEGPAVFTNNLGESAALCDIDLTTGTDLQSFATFQACFTDVPAPINACCTIADFNGDQAIDLGDYIDFHDALLGP